MSISNTEQNQENIVQLIGDEKRKYKFHIILDYETVICL